MVQPRRSYSEALATGSSSTIRTYYGSNLHSHHIFEGRCTDVIPRLNESNRYRLVFADPPFNIGYKYDEYKDTLTPTQYKEWCRQWLHDSYSVMDDSSSLVVAIGDEYAAEMKILIDELGLHMRNWIIWYYTFGTHHETKFGRNHTHLLYYVKNKRNFIFHPPREQSERQRLGDKRANPLGRVPGDVFKTTDGPVPGDVWSVPRLVGNAKERTAHPCQMPESILSLLIETLTDPGDKILDPFAGSGTTLAVGARLGRVVDTIELSPNYINNVIIPRLAKQNLPFNSRLDFPASQG